MEILKNGTVPHGQKLLIFNTARRQLAGFGNTESALGAGGKTAPSPDFANTETWNGSSWTEVNDLNNARTLMAGSGTDNTSGLIFGSTSQHTEDWNGVSWAEVANLNAYTVMNAGSTLGSTTATLSFGGEDPGGARNETEKWSGSTNSTRTVSTD